jgi:hypothetical protein
MKYQSFYYIGVYLGYSRIQFGYITYITYRIYIAIQYDTLQYKCKYTHKYNTIQYSTVQYSTIQYNTTHALHTRIVGYIGAVWYEQYNHIADDLGSSKRWVPTPKFASEIQ